jgi:tetratricopeptide (TPR) repeat protein
MKRSLPYIILFSCCCRSFLPAQNLRSDSLIRDYKNAAHDTSRINTLHKLFLVLVKTRVDTAEKVLQTAKAIATKDLEALDLSNSELIGVSKKIYLRKLALNTYFLSGVYYNTSRIKEAKQTLDTCIALQIAQGTKRALISSYNLMSNILDKQGDTQKALSYLAMSISICEELKDQKNLAVSLGDMGQLYVKQGQLDEAREYFKKSMALYAVFGNKRGVASNLNNLGGIKFVRNELDSALFYYLGAMKMYEELNELQFVSNSLNNLSAIYQAKGRYDEALGYIERVLKIRKELGNKYGIATALGNRGGVYMDKKNYPLARRDMETCLEMGREFGSPEVIMHAAGGLRDVASREGNYKNALEMGILYLKMRDSITNEDTRKASYRTKLKFEYDKKAAADSVQLLNQKSVTQAMLAESDARFDQQRSQRFILIGGLVLLLLFAAVLYNRFRYSQKQKTIIEEQKKVVDAAREKTRSSIAYAKKIQDSILPSNEEISQHFPEHFIFFHPKDLVSGDLYWFHRENNLSFIAVADCAAEGIPGAFMTLVAHSALQEAVMEKKLTDPGKILSFIHALIHNNLHHKRSGEYSQDAMDISLAIIDHDRKLLHFAGAGNNAYLIDSGGLREMKGDNLTVGGISLPGEKEGERKYRAEICQLNSDTLLFISSGGLLKQLNDKNEKFSAENLKHLLKNIQTTDAKSLGRSLLERFEKWKAGCAQTGDVLFAIFNTK